jgi:hypothetical protein
MASTADGKGTANGNGGGSGSGNNDGPAPRSGWRDVDPVPPDAELLARHGALVLDPLTATRLPGQPAPRPTVYVADTLIVPAVVAHSSDLTQLLVDAAGEVGLYPQGLLPDEQGDGAGGERGDEHADERSARPDLMPPARVVRLVPSGDQPVDAPDAWRVLQGARAAATAGGDHLRARLAGVGLNHLLFGSSHVAGLPMSGMSHVAGLPDSATDGLVEYVVAGSGGRAPVSWVGEDPDYELGWDGRRPVVAVLDTGCGEHPWLEEAVTRDIEYGGQHAGLTDAATDPERTGDIVGPMDGSLDSHSGHGTFIAGLLRQLCPRASIWAIRVMSSDGVVEEADLIRALGVLAQMVEDAVDAGQPPPVDIVSLSLGYYHELPHDQDFDPVLLQQIRALGTCGVAVLAAAGNDATSREVYPAAFLPHPGGEVETFEHGCVPVVSVGALNPDGTIALFSNGGDWVAHWQVGAALVSTFPTTFDGGGQPSVAYATPQGRRATMDPDRFTGGFGTWSGTSFSTPVLAGRLARRLIALDAESTWSDPVERMWRAVTDETGLPRPEA